ncbi:serine/threonine-protein kinase [Streptomyces sp. NBRC 109706]|uniref:serine/threonine-protein kinase n=1 Tax=Streptomyces sp. NBRC 109706 TaxID=1550035 RepID=UPI0007806976|nr:serine/threonine-protein kinase [Streptomyces sp. NBRC 109706]
MDRLRPEDPARIGDYRLVGRLGSGGMGQVFLGRSAGGRPVAVKVIRPEYGADPGFRRSFAREVEAARRVGGFFTAQVVDADPDAELPWLVSAYIAGPSLERAVAEHGPLPLATVRVLGAGLAEGLVAIHRCDLVHRDLKPGNVVLASDGPRVIDFGIARALEATTRTVSGVITGTPAYMSPEQARGAADIGPASDVFALGSVLAFAATGAAPFAGGHPAAVLFQVVQEEPELATLDAWLRGVVRACLAKDPADRPTPAELIGLLSGPEDSGDRPEHWASPNWLPATVVDLVGAAQDAASELETEPLRQRSVETTRSVDPPDEDPGDDPDDPPVPRATGGVPVTPSAGRPEPRSRGWFSRLRNSLRTPPASGNGFRDGNGGGDGDGDGESSIATGWNGLEWGATTADFLALFPDGRQENGDWWVTGEGPERFCGVTMDAQYAFGPGGGLGLVAFYPEVEDRDRLPVAVLETLGAPDGHTTRWTRGKVVVEVKVAGVAATVTHRRHAG